MAGALGAGQTGSAGLGLFANGLRDFSLAGLASWGGFAGSAEFEDIGNISFPCDDKDDSVLGAYAGGGVNLFITNANAVSELKGPAETYSFNVGWGKRLLSIQLTIGNNGRWLFSYGGPIPGVPATGAGAGFSISHYSTNTWGRTLLGP